MCLFAAKIWKALGTGMEASEYEGAAQAECPRKEGHGDTWNYVL